MNNININSKIHFGKPCVAGTRITVQNILELINEDIPFQDIIENYYPDLKEEKHWEEIYMANQCEFRAMAQQALEEFDTGRTTEMVIENGVITPVTLD